MAKSETETLEQIAKNLARVDGHHETQRYRMDAVGVEFPVWITYISEAKRIWRDRQVC